MRQLSWGATLKLNWGATLKWSEAPLWPKSGSPTNLMSCQSLAPTNLVWFPDWHECHFPSGLGNLTTLQTAPHLIHQHLKKNQTIFTLLHSWNVIQSESEMWQCRTDQFEKWCQKLVTEQHSTCLNFHCCPIWLLIVLLCACIWFFNTGQPLVLRLILFLSYLSKKLKNCFWNLL